jgi:hypothetical protein
MELRAIKFLLPGSLNNINKLPGKNIEQAKSFNNHKLTGPKL